MRDGSPSPPSRRTRGRSHETPALDAPDPPRKMPKHPYRDSALIYGALALVVVVLAFLTGGGVLRAVVYAALVFVAATAVELAFVAEPRAGGADRAGAASGDGGAATVKRCLRGSSVAAARSRSGTSGSTSRSTRKGTSRRSSRSSRRRPSRPRSRRRTRTEGRPAREPPARPRREVKPPSWNRAIKRGALFVPFLYLFLTVLEHVDPLPAVGVAFLYRRCSSRCSSSSIAWRTARTSGSSARAIARLEVALAGPRREQQQDPRTVVGGDRLALVGVERARKPGPASSVSPPLSIRTRPSTTTTHESRAPGGRRASGPGSRTISTARASSSE